MRKILLLALLVIFTLPIFAKHVDVETAKVVASTFWSQNVGKTTRSPFSDVTSQTEFTNFYILNTSDGFVIVSADDIATPILGYSENGAFSPENIPVNMYEWLQGYENEIQFGIENGVSASAEIAADWEKLSNGMAVSPKRSRAVNALVQTRWNQSAPYNNLCPYDSGEGERTVTGCVATAMAQIMKYWNYPTQGNGSVTYNATGYGNQTANFSNTTYDWSNMLNTYSNSATSAQKTAVATLMYHCGVAVQMSYGVSSTGGSGAVTVGPSNGTAEYAMKNYFLYKSTLAGRYKSNYNETAWKNMMYADLDASRPIIYTGRGDGGGHCFICDGYNSSSQFHFNWGWGGYCDGFYAINSLEPGTGGIGSGNGTYNESQSAIFGIEPNAGLFAIPSALTFSGLGGNKTFMVRASTSSNQSWTATSSQTWLTLSTSTGAGNGANTTVTANASRNNTASERSATITIRQGSETTTVTVVQPSGIANDPGCFGTDDYDYIYPIESGHMIVICGEGFGYFTTGHKVTKVKFTTVDGASTSSYTNYTNNSFTIKIYENGNTESLSSGYTSNIAGAMGTQVYSQNYTQTSFGEQEVILNTPYSITETKNFWIAVVANGNSIFRVKLNEYGEPVSEDEYEGYAAAANGKYLYTDTYNGTDYLNTNGTAYYTDENHTELQLYSMDFMLSFCTENPSLLAVTPGTLNFASAGGNLNFTVKANANVSSNWSAVSSASWLTLSPTSGNGNGATTTVTATAAENVSGAERSATITVTHGSETKVITVTQPDGSIAPTNTWYGNAEYNDYNLFTNTYQIVIRPENYGNFEAGNKILKVRFSTYNGARTSSYTDYTNTSFTIKIYENSSMDNNLINNGYTSSVNNCLGTVAYSQNYTAESFASDESGKTHIVDLETPYTIRNGVNFWIAVVANGNTLFLCNDVEVGEPIEVSSYVSSMGVAAASGNYLYTDSYNSVDYLNLNYAAYYADNSRTTVQTYSVEYALSYYISDGDSPYMPTSDFGAIFLVSNTDLHYADETMSLGATDNLVVYPGAKNNGPEDATQPISVSLKLGSEVLDEGTISLSETNSLQSGYFTWVYASPCSYTVTADQLNQMLVTGTFDVCFNVEYSGNDNNESNNTACITVTRATPSFTISASANPTAGGTVTGTGSYELGAGVNLVATPNAGYNFTNWTENGTVVSTNATYTFTATANRTLVANFTQRTYNVTATVDPANSGTISGNNSPYTYGSNVSLTANANAGYAFVNWTDEDANVVSTNANYQFTIDGNRTFVAHFEIEEYEITATANPTAGGSVTGAGTFQYGQTVTLRATANTGYTFTNWTENGSVVSTNATYSFAASASRTLVANFQINTYNISATANPTAGGTISGAGEYTHGQNVTLTATANTGYTFTNWTENGSVVSTNATYSFTASASRTLVANFQINTYSISATANPSIAGTILGAGEYNYGQTVTLSATANTGYHFVNWTENGSSVSTDAEYSFTVTANRTLVANFQINSYTISASANPTESGTVNGTGEYDYGQSATLTAVPNTGYTFATWTENGSVVSSNAQYTFTVSGSRTLVANFNPIVYTIAASASPAEGGSISGAGDYSFGQTVTLSATANTGYSFTNWTDGSNVVSTDANYSFTVSGNRTLVANFQINSYTISASANPTESGTVNGTGEYDYGQSATLTAVPNTGYTFATWTENGSVVSSNAQYTFTVSGSRTLVANFNPIVYTIAASASPAEGGSISGAGDYSFGQTVTLSATANTGYSFTNWTDGSNVVSTDANYSFTVSGNRTLVANFTINTYTVTAIANPTEGGTVAIDVASQNGVYSYGTNLVITATANDGYHFTQWSDGVTEAQRSYTVVADVEFVAYFTEDGVNEYTITATANPIEGGTIEGARIYEENAQAVLTATANTGYTFANWTEGGEIVSTNAAYSFTVTSDRTLVANFTINGYTISATANPTEGGSVEGAGNYNYGQNVTLTATANTGYTFTNWTENGEVVSTNAEYSFTATADRTLVANFTINGYTISATANPTDGGSVEGAGNYNYGQNVTLTATANTGYTFTNWTEGGEVVSTNAEYSFTATADRTLVANFTINTYAITVNVGEHGTVTYNGAEVTSIMVEEGSTPAFVITPEENYRIDVLSVDGIEEELTEEQLSGFTYTFEPVMSDLVLSVTFTRLNAADMIEAASIAIYPNPNNGIFTLSMESIEGDVTCQIVNASGSVIETREINATDGSEFVFDCNVAPGVYFVRVISGDRVWTESVVINR